MNASAWARRLLTALVLCSGAAEASAQTPNIVMILADDMGWRDLSSFGSSETHTPNLDRVAGEGVRFTNFYASAPVCSPSRASLLTGRFPLRAGIYSWVDTSHRMHLRTSETTIAELLRRGGYDTAHMGKWHLGYDLVEGSGPGPDPGDHGFDHWLATGNNAEPSHHEPINFVRNGKALGAMPGYSSQIVVDEAIQWLKARDNPRKPFYLNVWFHEPHRKVAAPAEFLGRHRQTAEPAYYGSIENMDNAVGRLIDHLRASGAWENTFLIFTSDNGSYMEGSAGPLRGLKTTLWEGGIRVPGIVRWPGHTRAGYQSETPAGIVDIFPTIAEAAGIPVPQSLVLDGVSLIPVLGGAKVERIKPLYWFYSPSRPVSVTREGDWSLVADTDVDLPTANLFREEWIGKVKQARLTNFRLYDLSGDPRQTKNLATAQPQRFEAMKRRMVALHEEVVKEAYDWRLEAARPR